jgi:hypothetical protein
MVKVGFLRGVPPSLQVFSHCTNRHIDRKQPFHKLPNCSSGPKRERKLELFRTPVSDRLSHFGFLVQTQCPLHSVLSASFLYPNSFVSTLSISSTPFGYRTDINSDSFRNCAMFPAFLAKMDSLIPQLLLNLWAMLSGIYSFHNPRLTYSHSIASL